jgi:hypothetical protein
MKWAAARMAFLVAAAAGMASGTVLCFLLGPLYSWYFLKDLRYFKHRHLSLPLNRCGWQLVAEWFRSPAYRGMFSIPLTAPPVNGPDLAKVRIRADWSGAGEGCNGCTRCCILRSCPLLDRSSARCLSYGSFFWRYFNCGRYPENARQIRFYLCPKWETI